MTHQCSCSLPKYNAQQTEGGRKDSTYGIVSFIQRYMRNRTLTPTILQNVERASPLVQNITNQCHFGEWALFVCILACAENNEMYLGSMTRAVSR